MGTSEIKRLFRLAELIRRRNEIDGDIASIVGRPAEKGHVGEFLAGQLLGIDIERSATRAGFDGRFRSGPLAGRTVNVKWYAKREGLLDVTPDRLPDFYLVLAGPTAPAASSRGATRPWLIEEIFLFEARALVDRLRSRGIVVGVATSVRREEWEAARIYPAADGAPISLPEWARRLLPLLGPETDTRGRHQPGDRLFVAKAVSRPRDVVASLAAGEYHWKEGFSAYELAHSWLAADGFPVRVREALDSCPAYCGAELIEGYFERETRLDSLSGPSRTDLMVLARTPAGLAVMAVEGKAAESFGPLSGEWKQMTKNWRERLGGLCRELELDSGAVDGLRYQLLHRTVSAVLEARRYGCGEALMLVHAFADRTESFRDFERFAAALGLGEPAAGAVTDPKICGTVRLRLGWVADRPVGS